MNLNVKYVPLSFINTNEEILLQIKNSVLFSFLLKRYSETTLSHYLESTQYGYTASAAVSGKHKLVRITDINGGKVLWDQVPYCECDNEGKYLLKKDDILIARTGGTTGKSFHVVNAPENAVFASYLIRLRLKDKVDVEFIKAFLNSYIFWSQIVEMKSGSAMPNVNAEKLKKLRLPNCPIDVQKTIVRQIKNGATNFEFVSENVQRVEEFFNNKNLLSTELTHQLNLVKQLRQAFLREAMQGKLVPQDPSDEPATELLAKIKAEKERLVKEGKLKKQKPLPQITEEDILFEIPENWVWCRLGQLAYITSGSTPKSEAFVNAGIPYLKMYNLRKQKIDFFYRPQYIKPEIHNGQLKRCRAYPGDIIMNIVGPPLGKIAIIPDELEECNFNQAAVLIRPFEKRFNHFIFWYLNEMSEIKNIETKGVAGQNNISVTQAHNMRIPLPPLSEQQRIVAKLDELMAYCDKLEESIKSSQQQNEMLLQQVLREALEPGGKEAVSLNEGEVLMAGEREGEYGKN